MRELGAEGQGPAERRLDVETHLRREIELLAMESSLRAEVVSASYRYVLYKGLLRINSNIQEALRRWEFTIPTVKGRPVTARLDQPFIIHTKPVFPQDNPIKNP